MKSIILCLILVALATSKTIPELYSSNGGQFTADYSVTYNSPALSGEFGVMSEAGDINNDGIADFAISNPTFDNNKGIVYVIYGKKGSLRQFSSMNDFQPSDGFIIKGNTNDQKLGFSVSHAGDINGDGIDDLIIGSAFWNGKTGMVYVLFGRKSSSDFSSTVDVDRLASTQGFKVFGASSMDFAGYAVSGAGDVNGDGISDIVIGAFGANYNAGKAYVIFGSRQGLGDMKLPPAQGKGFTIEGSGQENFGAAVSKVGDFNGDGVDDLIIGAHCADGWTGRAYLIYGRRGGFPAVIKATDGMTLRGAFAGNNFGCSVSGAGDFNNDGFQDLIIGAYAGNNGNGAAYLILGSRQNPSEFSVGNMSPSRGFGMISSVYSQLGVQVSGGKDLNGDGVSDVVLGAPGFGRDKGAAYVIYGSRQSSIGFFVDRDLTPSKGYVMYGVKEGDRFGSFVRPLKDVNKDGVNDFLVGAIGVNGGKGAAYLFYVASVTCSANCASCSRPGTCDICAAGFGFLENTCVSCPANTHILSNGVCQIKCSANCARCSRPNTCDSCAQGFGFLDGSCISCPTATHILSGGFCVGKCTQNCQYCAQPGSCDVCSSGFGFLNGLCVSCPATHFLNGTICQERRPQNCVQWTNPDFCDICAPGFGFLGGSCVTCPTETYTLVNGSCKVKCSENCAQCTQPNTCDACSEGFGFLNDSCVRCPEKTHFLNNGFCLEDQDAWKQIKDLFGGLFH